MYFNRSNRNFDRGSKPATRPLPENMPEYIAVELFESVHNGQIQLTARYKLDKKRHDSEFIDVVVNIPRYMQPWPQAGEWWWVKPKSMAPHKSLVFAEAYQPVRDNHIPLTVRTGEELLLAFQWSNERRHYRSSVDGWTVVTNGGCGICSGESWRVKVEDIFPDEGFIVVNTVGPHPKTLYQPPAQVGLMSVISLFGKRETLEGDVFSYSRGWHDASRGGQLQAEFEHKGRIIRLDCKELRKVPAGLDKDARAIEKVVGFVKLNGAPGYLAELVLIEGETVQKPRLAEAPMLRRAEPPVEEHDPLDDPNSAEDILRDEYRANVDRRDYGYD